MATLRPDDVMLHDDSGDELITGEAVALQLRPTSFVLRAAGSAIDWLAYYGGTILIISVFISIANTAGLDSALTTAISISGLVIGVVAIPTAVETATQGKSLGRLAVGARIVRDDGGSIGFRHAFIRALLGLFELFMTFGGMAALVALFNAKAKRLGDLLAGTYSQHERISKQPRPVFGVPYALSDWARTADVARMPDQLARRVSQFLDQASGLTPQSRHRLATELANEVSVYVSPIPSNVDPELFIAAVSVVRRERELAALQLERRGLDTLRPALQGRPHGFPDRG